MGIVVPILGPRQPDPSPYEAFAAARRAMIRAYAEWLRTNPAPECVSAEVEGTHSAMDQLRRMEMSHG